MMAISSLAVFCGSKNGTDPLFTQHSVQLGKLMAENNVKLVYGGGSAGLMGAIADSVMENGGNVTGIIPRMLVEWEKQHLGISELIISDDMHERKRNIYSRCDAALILPGGFGTMDELFEIITWNQLTIHDKEIFILNSGGFYDHLFAHIEKMKKEGFLYREAYEKLYYLNSPADLLKFL